MFSSVSWLNTSFTCFLTAILVAAVRAVIFTIASPWQPDTAAGRAAELFGGAHGGGWKRSNGVSVHPHRDAHTFPDERRWVVANSFWQQGMADKHSLQFFSSDWSSQSNSPSHRQPALMHIPLLHMNSTERQGWWEAVMQRETTNLMDGTLCTYHAKDQTMKSHRELLHLVHVKWSCHVKPINTELKKWKIFGEMGKRAHKYNLHSHLLTEKKTLLFIWFQERQNNRCLTTHIKR